MTFLSPLPVAVTADGAPRKAGVEIEFAGLSVKDAAEAARAALAGELCEEHRYRFIVRSDTHGDTAIELDARALQEYARGQKASGKDPGLLDTAFDPLISGIVPAEIVSAPLPPEMFAPFFTLVERLREAGAKGTASGVTSAFGLHWNIETPAQDCDTLLRYLRAFSLLYEALHARMRPDFTRTLTRYAKPYPSAYIKRILADGYAPSDTAELIRDYAEGVGDRDRALDMLPLFVYIDKEAAGAAGEHALVKPRPAFHFRMPDCRIDEPGWNIDNAWTHWLTVEHIAGDTKALEKLRREFNRAHSGIFGDIAYQWAGISEKRLKEYGL